MLKQIMENYSSLNIGGCEEMGANVSSLTRKYQDKFSKQFLPQENSTMLSLGSPAHVNS